MSEQRTLHAAAEVRLRLGEASLTPTARFLLQNGEPLAATQLLLAAVGDMPGPAQSLLVAALRALLHEPQDPPEDLIDQLVACGSASPVLARKLTQACSTVGTLAAIRLQAGLALAMAHQEVARPTLLLDAWTRCAARPGEGRLVFQLSEQLVKRFGNTPGVLARLFRQVEHVEGAGLESQAAFRLAQDLCSLIARELGFTRLARLAQEITSSTLLRSMAMELAAAPDGILFLLLRNFHRSGRGDDTSLSRQLATRLTGRPELLLKAARAFEESGDVEHADWLLALAERHPGLRDSAPREPTNSTQLFRNLPLLAHQAAVVECLADEFSPIRVHVAAASSGEEAFSLAALVAHRELLSKVEFSASDLHPELVREALGNRIPQRRVRCMPEALVHLFTKQGSVQVRLDPDVHNSIRFSCSDLRQSMQAGATFHLFVANNVLVHLDDATKTEIVRNIVAHSSSRAVLVLGGDVHGVILPLLQEAGFRAASDSAASEYEAWTIQRNAWYKVPRPYWALPPFRGQPGQVSVFYRGELDEVRIKAVRVALLELLQGQPASTAPHS